RQNEVNIGRRHSGGWHGGCVGVFRVLHDGSAAAPLDLSEAGRTIVQVPTQDNSDGADTIGERGRTEEGIDRWPTSVFAWTGLQEHFATIQQHMTLSAGSDVNTCGQDWRIVYCKNHRQFAASIQNVRQHTGIFLGSMDDNKNGGG